MGRRDEVQQCHTQTNRLTHTPVLWVHIVWLQELIEREGGRGGWEGGIR